MGRPQRLLGKEKHIPPKRGSPSAAAQESISVLVEWGMLEEEGMADSNIRTLFHSPSPWIRDRKDYILLRVRPSDWMARSVVANKCSLDF